MFNVLVVLSCSKYLFCLSKGLWLRLKDSEDIEENFVSIIEQRQEVFYWSYSRDCGVYYYKVCQRPLKSSG